MKKRILSVAIILLALFGIIHFSTIKSEAKDLPLRVDAMFQYVAPENLTTNFDYCTSGLELSEFSISLPENKCCIIISSKDQIYGNTLYKYLGFKNDVFYFKEI